MGVLSEISKKEEYPPKLGVLEKVLGVLLTTSAESNNVYVKRFLQVLSRFFRIRRFVGISVYFGKIMLMFSGILHVGVNIFIQIPNVTCEIIKNFQDLHPQTPIVRAKYL